MIFKELKMETLEQKLQNRKDKRDLNNSLEVFSHDEVKTIHKGRNNFLCKIFGHKRQVHHSFFKEETEDKIKRYEMWVCRRCADVEGVLVMINNKKA
jgi:hypothetical protein